MNNLLKRSLLQDATRPWENVIMFLVGWLGFQLLGLCCSAILSPMVDDGRLNSNQANMAINLIVYGIITFFFLIYILGINRNIGHTIRIGFTKNGGCIWNGFLYFIGCLFISGVYSMLVNNIPWMAENANQSGLESLVGDFPIPLFIMTVFLAPFCEELTYRGGLNTLISRWNKLGGLLISAAIFGLIHFDFQGSIIDAIAGDPIPLYRELLNLPTYILSGIGLGLAYQSTGNIVAPWACHTFNNFVATITMIV